MAPTQEARVEVLEVKVQTLEEKVENLETNAGPGRADAQSGNLAELRRQFALHGDERLEGEIRIDRFGAVAGEAGEMVHFARLAGLDDKPDRGAQAFADQVVMHRRTGEQRWNGNAVCAGAAVGENDDIDAVAHRFVGLRTQSRQRGFHAGGAVFGRPGCVKRQ